MQQNYSVLAKYYDKFTNKDCDYVKWSQYLCDIARAHNVRQIADIACGTGTMTQLLVKQGFDVVGVDASAEMLNEARAKTKALFVRQDMRKLSLPRPCDMAVCVNDGVNYLRPEELAPFFQRVSANLKKGAPFVFDVSSPYKLTSVVGDKVFYWDDENETLLWSNRPQKESVTMELTLFVRDGETYRRFDERHVQYIHTDSAICAALRNSGFELRSKSENYGNFLANDSLRLTFYAIRGI